MVETEKTIRIYYDGQCPFCSSYVQGQRLKALAGNFILVNLREDEKSAARLRDQGFDVNEGMIVEYTGSILQGADAMHALALVSTGIGPVNWITRRIFSHKNIAKIIYPMLKRGRNLTLRVLGRSRID